MISSISSSQSPSEEQKLASRALEIFGDDSKARLRYITLQTELASIYRISPERQRLASQALELFKENSRAGLMFSALQRDLSHLQSKGRDFKRDEGSLSLRLKHVKDLASVQFEFHEVTGMPIDEEKFQSHIQYLESIPYESTFSTVEIEEVLGETATAYTTRLTIETYQVFNEEKLLAEVEELLLEKEEVSKKIQSIKEEIRTATYQNLQLRKNCYRIEKTIQSIIQFSRDCERIAINRKQPIAKPLLIKNPDPPPSSWLAGKVKTVWNFFFGEKTR